MKTLLAVVPRVDRCACGFAPARAADAKIAVVAAENFYGDVAQQIGGDRVSVTSILSNPDQDPHLFETTPSDRSPDRRRTNRRLQRRRLRSVDGKHPQGDAQGRARRHRRRRPHAQEGRRQSASLVRSATRCRQSPRRLPLRSARPIPPTRTITRRGCKAFLASLAPLNEKIAAIRDKYAGAPVAASEPVFGYMAAALKLKMYDGLFPARRHERYRTQRWRRSRCSRDDLKMRKVRVLFYNKQAPNNLVQHLVDLARMSNIPVVGVTETCPPGLSYQKWMLSELDATEKALAGPNS